MRTKEELDSVAGLVIPGGESTTMALVAQQWGLIPELQAFAKQGRPIWGTCAGASHCIFWEFYGVQLFSAHRKRCLHDAAAFAPLPTALWRPHGFALHAPAGHHALAAHPKVFL